MEYDKFLELESIKNIGGYRQCAAHTKVNELLASGLTTIEKSGCFQPKELYNDVLEACKELGLKISQYIKEWEVAGRCSGCTVFMALTESINPSWCSHTLYKPIAL